MHSLLMDFDKQLAVESQLRKAAVAAHRNIMQRVVDVIIVIGCQGLTLTGHQESLVNDTYNCCNFLELLKLIAEYDKCSRNHFKTIQKPQQLSFSYKQTNERPKVLGRQSKFTFHSNDSQNKMIDMIGTATKKKISSSIEVFIAWALLADTIPDVSRYEQLSICACIVHSDRTWQEHILNCTKDREKSVDNDSQIFISSDDSQRSQSP